ncbi:MAG: 16S rRNA (adenine(1518)-N(6)/adenine(1519)-N(6))-dimethyltransferase RsmA [Elusimicrobiota bacterium]|nr:16S rRNA (adenine(1518)-N(6)/adenine(1519)-N(6))-dimethyltransferase RsmA [Elusimicrobiota bacterium]
MPKYSQVFLNNDHTALAIAESINNFDCDLIIEIGPGKGVLTKHLLKVYQKKLLLVEIDGRMVECLKSRFKAEIPPIIKSDFMRLDLSEVFSKYKKVIFIGNLPYHCATAILEKVLLFDKFAGASFMFQKEMGERILALANDKDYGYFSVFSQIMSEAFLLLDVPKGDFTPVPKIDSRVIVFQKRKDGLFKEGETLKKFLSLIKSSFSHRRKTILNSLALSTGLEKERLLRIFEEAQIMPSIRPQNLSLEDFKRLYKAFNI